MQIEGRGKKAAIISLVWMIVPLIVAIGINESLLDETWIILTIVCCIPHFLGAIIYTGSYEAFAGFNTSNEEELKEYDLVKMTSFLGLSWIAASYLFFAILLVGSIASWPILYTLLGSILVLIVILTISGIYAGVGKRFKVH